MIIYLYLRPWYNLKLKFSRLKKVKFHLIIFEVQIDTKIYEPMTIKEVSGFSIFFHSHLTALPQMSICHIIFSIKIEKKLRIKS